MTKLGGEKIPREASGEEQKEISEKKRHGKNTSRHVENYLDTDTTINFR